jgi:hypothetical protein
MDANERGVGPENPPAFPRDERYLGHNGMTLRDYFAGQALPTVIAGMQSGDIGEHPVAGRGPAGFSATAYDVADAMLAARGERA